MFASKLPVLSIPSGVASSLTVASLEASDDIASPGINAYGLVTFAESGLVN